MISVEHDLLPVTEFLERLSAIRSEHSVTGTEFVHAISEGTAPVEAIRRWSLEWHHLTLRTAPPQVRVPYLYRDRRGDVLEHAVDNAMGEIGYLADPPHPDLARAMCYGLGVTDDEIDAYVPTAYMLWYMAFAYLGTRGQSSAVTDRRVKSASNVVIEGDASATAVTLVEGLQHHYGLDDAACVYWLVHGYADAGHAEEGAAMTVAMCDTRALQNLALEVAERSIKTRRLLWASWSDFLGAR